jgi:hypothetical protein
MDKQPLPRGTRITHNDGREGQILRHTASTTNYRDPETFRYAVRWDWQGSHEPYEEIWESEFEVTCPKG